MATKNGASCWSTSALVLNGAWVGVVKNAAATTNPAFDFPPMEALLLHYCSVLFCLFVSAFVLGALLSWLSSSSQKVRYALAFAGAITLLSAVAIPFFGWRPPVYAMLAFLSFLFAESVASETVPEEGAGSFLANGSTESLEK